MTKSYLSALGIEVPASWKDAMLSNRVVRNRLRVLEEAEFDKDAVLEHLYAYCERPNEDGIKLWREKVARRKKQVQELIRSVRRLGTAIEAVEKEHSVEWIGLLPAVRGAEVKGPLDSVIRYLTGITEELKKTGGRGKGRNEFILAILTLTIERVLGRPHYKELADLLTIAYDALKVETIIDPKDVEKRVLRAIQKSPEVHAFLEEIDS